MRSTGRIPLWSYALPLLVLMVNASNIFTRLKFPDKAIFADDLARTAESNLPAFILIGYCLALIISTTSLFILYKKPYDLTARLFFLYLQLLVMVLNFRIIYLDRGYAYFASVIYIVSSCIYGVVLLHFMLTLNRRLFSSYAVKRFLAACYFIGIFTASLVSAFYFHRMMTGTPEAASLFETMKKWSGYWIGLMLLLSLISTIVYFNALRISAQKKQIRLLAAGALTGLALPIISGFFPNFFSVLEKVPELPFPGEIVLHIGNYVMITLFAIAIFQDRFWSLEPIFRKTIYYSTASIFIYSIFIFQVSAWNLIFLKETSASHFIIMVFSMMLFLSLRDKLQRITDRLFHRERYNSAKVASEFEEIHSGIYQTEKLKSTVIPYLNSIFHFKSICYLKRIAQSRYKSILMYGIDLPINKDEFTINQELEYHLEKSKVISTEELRTKPYLIEISNGDFIIPVIQGERVQGMMIVGPKRSGKSYTYQDIQLLALLAHRIAALFHTSELCQQEIDRELMLERERTRIAKDFHDEVGASLTHISILSQMIRKNGIEPLKAKQWLQVISDTCQEASHSITHIIWALNPKNDTFHSLVAFIRRSVLEYLEPTSVRCSFSLQEELPDFDLNAEIRRNIYLCTREALHNVIKHARATTVNVMISVTDDRIIMKIIDNGIGFEINDMNLTGNGLHNMKRRMQDVSGMFILQSASYKGTAITLTVPVKAEYSNSF